MVKSIDPSVEGITWSNVVHRNLFDFPRDETPCELESTLGEDCARQARASSLE